MDDAIFDNILSQFSMLRLCMPRLSRFVSPNMIADAHGLSHGNLLAHPFAQRENTLDIVRLVALASRARLTVATNNCFTGSVLPGDLFSRQSASAASLGAGRPSIAHISDLGDLRDDNARPSAQLPTNAALFQILRLL